MQKIKRLEVVDVAIADLELHPHNPRQGDIGEIMQSLEAHGQFRAIVVQKSRMRICAGNHTTQAAQLLGWKTIAAHVLDIDDDQALRILLADNQTGDQATNDPAILADLLEGLIGSEYGLEGTGFTGDDLDQLIADLDFEPVDEVKEPGEIELPLDPVTKPGDVWLLGPHRLICGDSSEPTVLDKAFNGRSIDIVLTDPPYGINLKTDWSKKSGKNYRPVANDDVPFDASLLRKFFATVEEQFWWGANYYHRTLAKSDLNGSWLVWDKRTPETDVVIGSGFELCWSATPHKQDVLRYHWTNFTSHKNAGFKRAHPTEKPVALLVEILNRWSSTGSQVADPFAGSGTTLIAAHDTGRIASLVELDPAYCDVICNRFQGMTEITPILEATGEEVSFVDA